MSKENQETETTAASKALPSSSGSRLKWEYRTHCWGGGKNHTSLLAAYGQEGWELCGVIPSHKGAADMDHGWPDVVEFIFKRPTENK